MSENARAGIISTRYEANLAVVRLVGPVTVPSILELCDEVDLALGYYQYERLDLEIDSPGGDVSALEYLLTRWHAWKALPAVKIGTLALTSAASAAAIMLSLGDVGLRRTYPSCRLIYHDPRLTTQAGSQTRVELAARQAMLDEVDRRMLDRLTTHIWHGVLAGEITPPPMRLAAVLAGERTHEDGATPSEAAISQAAADDTNLTECAEDILDLRSLYSQLNSLDTTITPSAARQLGLIDAILN